MGNLVKWKSIDSESTFDTARIYRATSESGSYSQIATQTISDTSYYDPDGTSSSWYKVDFYDTTNAVASDLSSAMQADTFDGYCQVEDVRNMTNISSSDLNDTQVIKLIEYAGSQLNADVQVYHEEERIQYIDNTKDNEIDGSNTTFYTQNYPIGDLDDDMDVDTSDIEVFTYDSDGTRTEVTVSTITPNEGKFVLESAPSSDLNKVTVTYKSCQRSVSDPDQLIKMACALLTAAWAYTKINVGKAPRWRMGSTQIWRDMDSFDRYYAKYLKVLAQINDRSMADSVDATNIF